MDQEGSWQIKETHINNWTFLQWFIVENSLGKGEANIYPLNCGNIRAAAVQLKISLLVIIYEYKSCAYTFL